MARPPLINTPPSGLEPAHGEGNHQHPSPSGWFSITVRTLTITPRQLISPKSHWGSLLVTCGPRVWTHAQWHINTVTGSCRLVSQPQSSLSSSVCPWGADTCRRGQVCRLPPPPQAGRGPGASATQPSVGVLCALEGTWEVSVQGPAGRRWERP